MNVTTFRLELIEPLLATQLAGDPNSSVSYAFAPGSLIRGAMIAAHSRLEPGQLDVRDDRIRRLFFDGRTRYLNAYPEGSHGRRMLPVPRSWLVQKGDKEPVYDFAVAVPAHDEAVQFKPKGNDDTFCGLDEAAAEFCEPSFQINVHTARDRLKGYAQGSDDAEDDDNNTKTHGAVFRYEALAAGTILRGAILASTAEDAQYLAQLLPNVATLGGSSNGGYGRVAITVDEPAGQDSTAWREINPRPSIKAGVPFTVLFTSDALLRDPLTGQATLDPTAALGQVLATQLNEVASSKRRPALRTHVVGGFNRHAGLPLSQVQAIAAGSVFVYTADQPVDAATIYRAEVRGIGERRAEGFGAFVIGWNHEAQIDVRPFRVNRQPPKPSDLAGPALLQAQTLLQRMLRSRLEEKLVQRVNDLEIKQPPANSQLGRLRVIARDGFLTHDLSTLSKVIQEVTLRRSTSQQFERCRVDGLQLPTWLKQRLERPELVWAYLGVPDLRLALGTNVVSTVVDDNPLAQEYTIRLIDAVLAKAAQERRRQTKEVRP